MRTTSSLLPLLLFSSLVFAGLPFAGPIPPSFLNTDVVRTVELGPSVYTTSTYSIKSLSDTDNGVYYLTLSEEEGGTTSWVEAKVKSVQGKLDVKRVGQLVHTGAWVYEVQLPKPLETNATLNLLVSTVQSHATYPKPAIAGQDDPHLRVYEADGLITTPYETASQRLRIKAPLPHIVSTSASPALEALAKEVPATTSGATVTFGPFKSHPATATPGFDPEAYRVSVHFEMNIPALTVVSLKRAAEVSHWGANLNIQDEYVIRNDGPKLKGQFSRLEYQMASMQRKPSAIIIPGLSLQLPPGAHDAYYFDTIGNVSTSSFRPARQQGRSARLQPQYSQLDLRPRYPLLGGWNYTFTVGWDAPLGDSEKWDAERERWVLAVPFLTPLPATPVDEAEVKIILPEGATDIAVHAPFPTTMERSTHITYLDTIGRPAFTFKSTNLTEKHDELIYITYRVPIQAHLQKPLAVAAAALVIFSAMWTLKRVDMTIRK